VWGGSGPGNNERENTNMKSIFKNALGLASVLAVAACLSVQGADVLRPGYVSGQPYALVDSAAIATAGLNTNVGALYATNGYYPKSIAVSTGLGLTNCLVIPTGGAKAISLQCSGQAPGGAGTAVFTFKCATKPPTLGYSEASYGMGGYTNSDPMATFMTITLATLAANITTTNINVSEATGAYANPNGTTATLGAVPYIILESISCTGYALSNYSVWFNLK
jgi:hypothetical protein